MILNKKSVLIPIPWVSHNEQLLNAQLVARTTGSLILEEKDLSPENLYRSIMEVGKTPTIKQSSKLPTDATKKILSIIHQYV
jgi:UDP-N-acetylglucosamine:LPS N-acetylglucosamine transferase